MPILSWGEYTATTDMAGSDLLVLKSDATFTMYSVMFIPAILLLALAVLVLKRFLQDKGKGKYVVLFPAALGVILLVACTRVKGNTAEMLVGLSALPLSSQALSLLIWNAFRSKGRFTGIAYGYLSALLCTASLFYFVEPRAFIMIPIMLLYALFVALPTLTIRLFFQNKLTKLRGSLAYLLGSVIPGIIVILLTEAFKSPNRGIGYFLCAFFLLSPLPLLALSICNKWAREIVTGRKFSRTES